MIIEWDDCGHICEDYCYDEQGFWFCSHQHCDMCGGCECPGYCRDRRRGMNRWWAWRRNDLAPRRARHAIYRIVRPVLGEDLAAAAELCVSELVTNVLRYGRGVPRASLWLRPDGLLCIVRDDGPMSEWRDWPADSERGRGLALVLGVADGMGVCSEGSGKVAWFILRGGQ